MDGWGAAEPISSLLYYFFLADPFFFYMKEKSGVVSQSRRIARGLLNWP